MKRNEYNNFLQKSSKTELVSFFRKYGESIKRRKKFISPEDYFNSQLDYSSTEPEEIDIRDETIREPFKEVSK